MYALRLPALSETIHVRLTPCKAFVARLFRSAPSWPASQRRHHPASPSPQRRHHHHRQGIIIDVDRVVVVVRCGRRGRERRRPKLTPIGPPRDWLLKCRLLCVVINHRGPGVSLRGSRCEIRAPFREGVGGRWRDPLRWGRLIENRSPGSPQDHPAASQLPSPDLFGTPLHAPPRGRRAAKVSGSLSLTPSLGHWGAVGEQRHRRLCHRRSGRAASVIDRTAEVVQ